MLTTKDRVHKPVLLKEVLHGLSLRADGHYVDCTFGCGGHSRAILAQLGESGSLWAMDRDPEALASVSTDERCEPRFQLLRGTFSMLAQWAKEHARSGQIDGILFDLGVSSPQLDSAQRGFSFQQDGPLDMRMDPTSGISAATWLSSAREEDITTVLQRFGEERCARQIAREIITRRESQPILTTNALADLVKLIYDRRYRGPRKKHPATKTFQAIRIYINQELEQLQQGLEQSLQILSTGGRLLVISFHSVEDRLVKRFMRDHSISDHYSKELPLPEPLSPSPLRRIGRAIRPSLNEIKVNPRARSAILRIAEKMVP